MKDAGFKIYADTCLLCGHLGYVEIGHAEILQDNGGLLNHYR